MFAVKRHCKISNFAQNEAELEGLEELFRRAKANDVPVERVTESEARELEPLIKTHKYALWSPTTAAAGANAHVSTIESF